MKYLKWMCLILICLGIWIAVQIPDGKMHVVFCDVGQGDAELIVYGSVQVLIDGGPKGERLLDCLSAHMPFWDRTIEVVMNSHPQRDHIAGLFDVVERYRVLQFVRASWPETAEAKRMEKLLMEKKVKSDVVLKGGAVKIKDIQLKVLWPPKIENPTAVNENDDCQVVELNYDRFKAIFTGDIGTAVELALIDSGVITGTAVLKVAHHGSKFSSSEDFVAKLRPKLAVFEVGANNSYGHPNGDILKRFDTVGTEIKRTDKDGTVEVITDGKGWWIKK